MYRHAFQVSQLVTFYTLSVDFCHTCLLYSKIDVCIPICFCVINIGVFYFLHRIEFSAETIFVTYVKNL